MIFRLVDHFIAASKVCKQFALKLFNKAVTFLQIIIAPVKSTVLNGKPQKECILFCKETVL